MKELSLLMVAIILMVLLAITDYLSGKVNNLKSDNATLSVQLSKQTALITSQQERIQHLAELDKTHTQELAHAKTEIDTLRADVAAGHRKLRIQATCPVREATSSGSVVTPTTVELSGETGSTVLDIREGIINDRAKLKYLQGYVKTECR